MSWIEWCVGMSWEQRLFSSAPTRSGRLCRQRVIVCAESSPSVRGNTTVFRSVQRRHSCERVLRYVDGKERRIRYPCDVEEDGVVVCTEPQCTVEADARIEGRVERPMARPDDVGGTREGVLSPEEADSPLDFLRHVMSKEYQEKQVHEYKRVKDAFYVAVDGCPWPVPRPVYTIVMSDEHGKHAMYTLRTRIHQHGVESELNSLLFSKREDHVIRCSSLVDGVLMFQSKAAAIEYGEMVEMTSVEKAVRIAEHDSHSIFKDIVIAKAVAVVMKEGHEVPDPQKLRAVLLDSTAGSLYEP